MALDEKILNELQEQYDAVSSEGPVTAENVWDVFHRANLKLPKFQFRTLCDQAGKSKDAPISFKDVVDFAEKLNANEIKGPDFTKNIQTKSGITQVSGYDATSASTVHSINDSERISFTNFINERLKNDPDCKKYLPLNRDTDDLFNQLGDGVLLCKLVNISVDRNPPIDERAIIKKNINKFTSIQNLSMALNSAKSIGLHITNISGEDIFEAKIHLCLGILWQIIRKYYMINLNLEITPDLLCLLRENETLADFQNLSPEEILLRWIEFQIRKVGCDRQVKNFDNDLKDSVVYAALETAIMKDQMLSNKNDIENTKDLYSRAGKVIENSSRAGIAALVTPYDIVNGNQKLNTLYVAEMFRKYPCLEKVEMEPIIETREVKGYKNWMNSIGVDPHVTYFFPNLADGIVLLKLCDIIRPGVVNFKKITFPPFVERTAMLKKTENCNLVVKIADSEFGLSIVNIDGSNIVNSDEKLVLGLVWQLMRMYTVQHLATLSDTNKPLKDEEILEMVNQFYQQHGKNIKLKSFKDPQVLNSHAIFEFVDAIQPGIVIREAIAPGNTPKECLENANYALSVARKVGAIAYALPEDIVEGVTKMIMILFAFLLMTACRQTKTH